MALGYLRAQAPCEKSLVKITKLGNYVYSLIKIKANNKTVPDNSLRYYHLLTYTSKAVLR